MRGAELNCDAKNEKREEVQEAGYGMPMRGLKERGNVGRQRQLLTPKMSKQVEHVERTVGSQFMKHRAAIQQM